ncbi:OmpA family protein [Sinorhizobium medicae]|uniref:OmpA family protein n=1 Tax=Sinorhizobium medicae TaxID=110321 RepID=UPI000462A260|nr:OmpA family protein [Sinorhizobium medicae]MDX0431126.1 OmpA family protein [Sinorhizobium medicae]MDX0442335.1 OmpA family protein [Sinorhizobium medicae]MDX0463823.1 OmpA family protein [Sinorhizobium medicae]MDX0488458.1 OmpA family protein [Sinorhizobium medicae]MDX0500756.1 OmpA family protein [Sinorhizobium medicae]
MSIRSRLFATVALPVLSASLVVQPAFADSLSAPFEVAQEGADQQSPEDLLLLKRKQRQGEEESQGQAEEQQPAAEESAPQQAEEEAPRRKKRQQQAEEQQPAAEESAPQQAEEEAPRRKKRQQQAEEQQPAAEESAPQQAEEEAPRRKKRQQQAEEQQPAAEESAPQQAEEEAPRRKKRQQQAEEQQPAAEESAPQQAEEEAPARRKRQQQAKEQQPAAEEGTPQQAEEQLQTDEQKAAEQPGTQPESDATAEQPAPEAPAEQTGEGEQQPVPGTEQPATAEQQGDEPEGQQAPEVVDERSTEERQKIADDPSASDDTVVLPVERGAAVLDSDKDADIAGGNEGRETRRKQREELRATQESVEPPADDAAAQAAIPAEAREEIPQKIEAALSEEGERVEEAPTFAVPQTTNIVNNTVINNTQINNTTVNNTTQNNVTEVRVVEEVDDRVILGVGDRIFVRGDDRPRLRLNSEESFYENLPRGRVRETIVRPGGYRIVTIYNQYGDVLTRTRIDRGGDEYIMMYSPEYEDDRPAIIDVGYELPPMRLTIPVDDYIVDYADDPDRDYYEFLSEPPVETVERVYTIDEVRHSARLRDKVRRIDLDTITFATGSAEVSMSQAKTMRKVAEAMNKVLEKDPGETFFIEGHTDAVGADQSNLVLSDERAESVAVLLTEVYGVPAENLVTQGYGERFLKIRTDGPEQENRRVTIRRVTPLVRPVAQR